MKKNMMNIPSKWRNSDRAFLSVDYSFNPAANTYYLSLSRNTIFQNNCRSIWFIPPSINPAKMESIKKILLGKKYFGCAKASDWRML